MTYLHSRLGAVSFGRIFVLLCLMGFSQLAMAQSTIFNIPSTDTVAPKKAYAEFDYLPEMPAPDGFRVQNFVPRIVVGIAPNVEVGANFLFSHISGFTSDFIQPNLKWKFYNDDKKGWAATAGVIWYAPINHRTGVDNYGLIYGNVSKKLMGKKGPRLTIGPYGVVAASESFGTKGGVIAGYEQPLSGKISFVADWFSGTNGFGYFTPGVSITLPHNGLFNAGYSLGNDSYNTNKDNKFLFLYYGITFP